VIGAIFFIIGAMFGSLANVCIYRMPKNKSIVFNRSACPYCRRTIAWYYNIPIVSFLLLKGKSHCCKKKINPQYLLVELLTAVLFYLNVLLFPINQAILLSGITFFFIVIFYIDLKYKIIFNIFSYLLLTSGLLINFYPKLNPFSISVLNSFLSAMISMLFFLLIRYLFKKIKKKEGMGLGDAKLIAGLSAWSGFESFLYILTISSLIGILYFLTVPKNKNKRGKKDIYIPYGSCLSFAFMILLYFNSSLLQNLI